MTVDEIIYAFKWVLIFTSVALFVLYVFESFRGSRNHSSRHLPLLVTIILNYEQLFLAKLLLGQDYEFLNILSKLGKEELIESIILVKIVTIVLAIGCVLLNRYYRFNNLLNIFVLSILFAYATNTYFITISTQDYFPGLVTSIVFVVPIWVLAIKKSFKNFVPVSTLAILLILAFLFNISYFFDIKLFLLA